MLQFWGNYIDQLVTENAILMESFVHRSSGEGGPEVNRAARSEGAIDGQRLAEVAQA
jgi:hypothetical protein